MKKILEWAALLAAFLVLAGCAGKGAAESKWEESLYRTVVYNSGWFRTGKTDCAGWFDTESVSTRPVPRYGTGNIVCLECGVQESLKELRPLRNK